jgi:NAD(P)-dependent dehydrogenase (short-subunit alcohol dehydrogenase family)
MKVALVTAGGSGMGAASARRLAADGFKVGILSSSGKGEALANELGGIGVTGSNQSVDDLGRLVDAAMQKWGRVDVLVNSAGHGPRKQILELTDEDWHAGTGGLFPQCRAPHPAGNADHATAESRRNHQHLHRLDV